MAADYPPHYSTDMHKKNRIPHWAGKTSGYQKLLIASALACIVSLSLWPFCIGTVARTIIGWDVFAFTVSAMMWALFFTTSASEQQEIVKSQDDDIAVIFAIIVIAVCVSFTGAVLLTFNSEAPSYDNAFQTVVVLAAIVASWILLHTIFTVRYAHLYHDATIVKTGAGSGGIDFPDGEAPDYIDFAYFSFVIGMTFQVSDVTVSSKTIRRYVLLHSLISFAFNTVIVALAVNIIAGAAR